MHHTILTHSVHPTARILAAWRFLHEHEKVFLITDDPKEAKYWLQYSEVLTGIRFREIETFAELCFAHDTSRWYFTIPSSLLTGKESWHRIEKKSSFTITRGGSLEKHTLIDTLLTLGYTYSPHSTPWTYRQEWDILHIDDPIAWHEIVVEYFDTAIDSILLFTDASRTFHESIRIYAHSKEWVSSTASEILFGATWNMDILHAVWHTPTILSWCDFIAGTYDRDIFSLSLAFPFFPHTDGTKLSIEDISLGTLSGLAEFLSSKKDVPIYCITRYEKALRTFLEDNALLSDHHRIYHARMLCMSWSGVIDGIPSILLGDDIFSQLFLRYKTRKVRAKDLDLLLHIRPWEYVVHRDHGIGKFLTLTRKGVGNIEREYMEIEYAENDRLFLPLTELHRISKYIGNENPEVTKLSGKEWERILEKTDEEVEAIAEELLTISARRRLVHGFSFPSFRDEEEKFRTAFPYAHTPDQLRSIEEIFSDMEKETPMDRLLAGDVGFGKTEVAMNAVYKAILAWAQVAVISPLLVLAEEHYETFIERMGPFGVRVAVLTRMQSSEETKRVITWLRNGSIDVVIGTHRLLSDDIHFRRLGLLIIDEEHRFWVEHKERFKKLKSHIDVLMLSATPIPRSLNLALSWLKTISMLTTAPYMRKSIRTIVTAWNASTIYSAIRYELERGGQILILHNRIRSIEQMKHEIEMLWNELGWKREKSPRIVTTHGKMKPEEIEDRIHAFKAGEFDILLSTTIIENGVNFLRANTILITDPEDFWLAQLHQLRGRVGRKDVEWVCYLLYREHHVTREGRDRMMTLAHHSELGAGFEIAMRDMEIRWVWDVLWFRQAGKSKDVGISLYFQMLEEKVEALKSGKNIQESHTKIELTLSTALPSGIFDSDIDRLSFYRDIEAIDTLDDLDAVEETFLWKEEGASEDTGENGLHNLFLLLRTRIILRGYGVSRVHEIGENYIFDFDRSTPVDTIRSFLERFDGAKRMILLSPYKIRLERKWWKHARDMLRSMIVREK